MISINEKYILNLFNNNNNNDNNNNNNNNNNNLTRVYDNFNGLPYQIKKVKMDRSVMMQFNIITFYLLRPVLIKKYFSSTTGNISHNDQLKLLVWVSEITKQRNLWSPQVPPRPGQTRLPLKVVQRVTHAARRGPLRQELEQQQQHAVCYV